MIILLTFSSSFIFFIGYNKQLTKYCYMMNSKEGEKMFTLLINNKLSALLV